MLFFPQLSTGALAQFPLERRSSFRTVVNELADGHTIEWADEDAQRIFWSLRYRHLTDDELQAIRSFFTTTKGRCETFAFPDPADNLLRWSGDLSRTVWHVDPLLQVSGQLPDPLGTSRAQRIVNSGSVEAEINQTLVLSSAYSLCFSGYIRSESTTQTRFELACSTGSIEVELVATGEWSRFKVAGCLGGNDEAVTVAVHFPPASVIDIFGLQLEAQVGPSDYKQTTSRSGVYPNTRFDNDRLVFTASDHNDHSLEVKLVSRVKSDE